MAVMLPEETELDFGDTSPPNLNYRLLIERIDKNVDIKLKVSDILERSVASSYLNDVPPEPSTLFRINTSQKSISIFPQIAHYSERLYQPRYRHIRELKLRLNIESELPTSHDDAVEVLKNLPRGFIQEAGYGLGLVKEMRPLINAIEKIDGITTIELCKSGQTRVEGRTFFMTESDYTHLQNGMSRITRGYQSQSLADRVILAHNASAHVADPDKFPQKERPYQPGTIFKLLGGSLGGSVKLRGKDRASLLNAVAGNAKNIANRDPKEFVQLQKDIEVVSLDNLIIGFEKNLKNNSQESVWQKLLEINPFLLSMLFGQPIVLLQPGASVGGQTVAGGGTKIADFLGKNTLSHNAVLVEIKRPDTKLLGPEYRSGVFPLSLPLMGSVAQVLDQRLKLTTEISNIKHKNKSLRDLEVYTVECVVVAGLMPKDDSRSSSFEIARNQMKDVRIITFDELLEKLQILRELLSGQRYISSINDREDTVGVNSQAFFGSRISFDWEDDPDGCELNEISSDSPV